MKTHPPTAENRESAASVRNLLILAVLVTQAFPCFSQASGSRGLVLATVNEDTIWTQDVDGLVVKTHMQLDAEQKIKYDYQKLLKKLVNDRLIIQEAKSMGLDQEPWLLETLEQNREGIALAHFLKKHYRPDVTISQKDIKKEFRHYYRKMQVRTLSVKTENEAVKYIKQIKQGASMDSIAKAVSLDSKKYQGGLHNLKYYADTEIPLRLNAENLKIGSLSAPFPYREVFAFLRLEKNEPADPADLPKYEKKIRLMLEDVRHQEKWVAFLDSLQKKYPLTFDKGNLLTIMNDSGQILTQNFVRDDSGSVMCHASGRCISAGAFRKKLSHFVMGAGNENFSAVFNKTKKALSAELILNVAAEKAGMLHHPDVEAQVRRSLDSALIEVYIKDMVASKITFQVKDLQEYYDQHKTDFRKGAELSLEELHASSAEQAGAFIKYLENGVDFQFLMEQDTTTTLVVGKNRKWISLDVFPQKMKEALEPLQIGAYSISLKTTEGWVIFHVKDRKEGSIQPLDQVEKKIREILYQKEFNTKMDEVLAILKKNAAIHHHAANQKAYFGNAE